MARRDMCLPLVHGGTLVLLSLACAQSWFAGPRHSNQSIQQHIQQDIRHDPLSSSVDRRRRRRRGQEDSCVDNFVAADSSNDQQISTDEYLSFLSNQSGGRINATEFSELPFDLISIFAVQACASCYRVTQDEACCDGGGAAIDMSGQDQSQIAQEIAFACSQVEETLLDIFPPPSAQPSAAPTQRPSHAPTRSVAPTSQPTKKTVTNSPTVRPTIRPTSSPSQAPTLSQAPSAAPSTARTDKQSRSTTNAPTTKDEQTNPSFATPGSNSTTVQKAVAGVVAGLGFLFIVFYWFPGAWNRRAIISEEASGDDGGPVDSSTPSNLPTPWITVQDTSTVSDLPTVAGAETTDVLPLRRMTLTAPPGDLGIVLGTSESGHTIVLTVRSTSVIRHLVRAGDIIVAVEDVEVTEMTSLEVSRLIVANANKPERKLSILGAIRGRDLQPPQAKPPPGVNGSSPSATNVTSVSEDVYASVTEDVESGSAAEQAEDGVFNRATRYFLG